MSTELVDRQRRVYDTVVGDSATFGSDQTLADHDPAALADRLAEAVRRSGATSIDLRVHLPGMSPESVREQIDRLAAGRCFAA